MINKLPIELILIIFSFCNYKEIINLTITCKYFYKSPIIKKKISLIKNSLKNRKKRIINKQYYNIMFGKALLNKHRRKNKKLKQNNK